MTGRTSNQSGVSGTTIDRRTVLQATATTGAAAVAGVGVSGSAGATTTSVSFERTTIESYDGTELGATL